MAKDKGKKKADDKAPKKSKGGGDDDFARPSDAPASGDAWTFEHEDNVGKLFLIRPLREQDFTSELYGTSKIVVADIVELDEKKPGKSVEHEEVYVFGGWTKGSLRGYIPEGKRVLARLAQDQAKSKSKNPAWVLEDATKADAEVARAYIAAVVNGAVSELAGSKKDKGEKKGKGKKK